MTHLASLMSNPRPRPIGYSMSAKDYASASEMVSGTRQVYRRMHPVEVVRVQIARPDPEPIVPPAPFKRRPHEYIFVHPTAYKNSGPRWQHSTAEVIVAEVCQKHGVSNAEIKGRTRRYAVVTARFEAYSRLSVEMGYSLPMIGRYMGGKDHTGVLHGIRKHKARMEAAGL